MVYKNNNEIFGFYSQFWFKWYFLYENWFKIKANMVERASIFLNDSKSSCVHKGSTEYMEILPLTKFKKKKKICKKNVHFFYNFF